MRNFDGGGVGAYHDREKKTPKDLESVREKRAQLKDLEQQYEKLDNFTWELLDKWNRHGIEGSRLRRLESMNRKSFALKEQATKIRFDLLPKKYQDELKSSFMNLQRELSELSLNTDVESAARSRAIKEEILFLAFKIPEAVRKGLEIPIENYDQNNDEFFARYEATAHEAINYGVDRLYETLHEIKEGTGSLPEKIIFPDTTSRPLRYAVKPLLDKVYKEAGEDLPSEHYVKTFSSISSENGHKHTIIKLEAELKALSLKSSIALSERDNVLRELKRSGVSKGDERLSIQAQDLWNESRELKQEIAMLKEKLRSIDSFEYADTFKDRLDEVVSGDTEARILVIDDLVCGGRTFGVFDKAFADMGVKDNVNFFAFIAYIDGLEYKLPGIEPEKISFGVGLGVEDGNSDKYSKRCGYIPGWEEESSEYADGMDWSELQFAGFPFRDEKEQVTGVRKDQTSNSKYVKLSPKRDFQKMNDTRMKYKKWGTEAVSKLKND